MHPKAVLVTPRHWSDTDRMAPEFKDISVTERCDRPLESFELELMGGTFSGGVLHAVECKEGIRNVDYLDHNMGISFRIKGVSAAHVEQVVSAVRVNIDRWASQRSRPTTVEITPTITDSVAV